MSPRVNDKFGHCLDLRAFIPEGVTDTTAVDCTPYIAQALANLRNRRGRLEIGNQFYLVASPIETGEYSVFIHGDGADVSGFIGSGTDAVIAHRPVVDNLQGVFFGEDFSVRSIASTPTRFGIDIKYPVDATIITDHEGNYGFARDGNSSPTGRSASDSTQQSKPGVMLRRVKVLSNQDGSSTAASFRTALRLYGATVCLIDDFVATANPGGMFDTYGIELGGYTRAVRIESPQLENFHIAIAPTSYWEGITVNRPQATNVDHLWRSPNADTKDFIRLGINGGFGDEVNIINAGEVVCWNTAIHIYQAFRTFISGCHLETHWRPGMTPQPVVILEDCEETKLLDCFVVQTDPIPGRTSIAVHITGQAGGGNQAHVHDVACRGGWIEFDDKTYFCNSSRCTAFIGYGINYNSIDAVIDHGTGNVISYDMPKHMISGQTVFQNIKVSGSLTDNIGHSFIPAGLTHLSYSGSFMTTEEHFSVIPFNKILANPYKAYDNKSHMFTVPDAGYWEIHIDLETVDNTLPYSKLGISIISSDGSKTTNWSSTSIYKITISATIFGFYQKGVSLQLCIFTYEIITLDTISVFVRRVG